MAKADKPPSEGPTTLSTAVMRGHLTTQSVRGTIPSTKALSENSEPVIRETQEPLALSHEAINKGLNQQTKVLNKHGLPDVGLVRLVAPDVYTIDAHSQSSPVS